MSIFPEHSLAATLPEREVDVAVIDLDNCVSDDKWRWPLIDLHLPLPDERYARYHDACDRDMHRNEQVVRALSCRFKIIVFTSRPECVRHKTQHWLNKWGIPSIGLFMRPVGNREPSVLLKRQMLLALPPHLKVRYAIDDRVDILDMYADEGVATCQRVFIHEPEVVHP